MGAITRRFQEKTDCIVTITNKDNKTTFSFRIPSEQEIAFSK